MSYLVWISKYMYFIELTDQRQSYVQLRNKFKWLKKVNVDIILCVNSLRFFKVYMQL